MVRSSIVVGGVVMILAGLMLPAVRKALDRGSARGKCGNNLKQLGLAANQYADAMRFYPHVTRLSVLDGDHTQETSSKAFRTLTYLDYMDQPESFVCPQESCPDEFVPLTDDARKDIRSFGWLGTVASVVSVSPLYQPPGAGGDKPLTEMKDLSYGWTRRGMTSNTNSANLLAGDKARIQEVDGVSPEHVGNMAGNHFDMMLAVAVDAHIQKITPEGVEETTRRDREGCIAGVSQGKDGFLGVLPDLAPGPPRSARKTPIDNAPYIFGIPGILAIFLAVVTTPRAKPATDPAEEPPRRGPE